MSVYTLELEGSNYYVGYSDDMPRRIAEHFLGRGSHWTRIHPPVKVLEVVPGNKELENAKTIALMCRLGWRKVRGGAWCATELKSMPIPLARALSQKPPKELPEDKGRGAYEYRGQAIYVREAEEGHVARVTGPLALRHSPEQGVKTLVGASESVARRAAERWVDARRVEEGTTEGEELQALRVEEETVEPDVRVRGRMLARGSPGLHKLKRVSSAKW